MLESIMISLRDSIGDDTLLSGCFDNELIMHINSLFMILTEIGIGPQNGFRITGTTEKWSDFFQEDDGKLDAAKTWMQLKLKLVFDPPSSSSVLKSMQEICSELEWRLLTMKEDLQT